MDALEICNKLRSEASGVATSGIPLDVFPQKMQQMILDLARTENYSIEFTATSLISAMAAAVGNSCYIRIKGNWITSPILYVILVGRPGVGKRAGGGCPEEEQGGQHPRHHPAQGRSGKARAL